MVTAVPLLLATMLPGASIEFFSPPPSITVDQKGQRSEYIILHAGKPLRASVAGPGQLTITARSALKRRDKKKRLSIRVVVDASDLDTFQFNTSKAAKSARLKFRGKGAPRGTAPSLPDTAVVPVQAGEFFYEFHLEGGDKVAFITLEAGDAPAEASDLPPIDGGGDLPPLPGAGDLPALPGAGDEPPLPIPGDPAASSDPLAPLPGGDDLAPLPTEGGELPLPSLDGDLPPLDGGALPIPGAGGDAAAPTAELTYFGDPPVVTVEEMGESKDYRLVKESSPLRLEIPMPGSLFVGVRVPHAGASSLDPIEVRVLIDGEQVWEEELAPLVAPAFAKTRFVSGGPRRMQPSSEEWFPFELPVGDIFVEFAISGYDQAFFSFEYTPKPVAPGQADQKNKKMLLTREQVEALQKSSEAGRGTRHRRGRSWRIGLEAGGGGAIPLAVSQPGFSGRAGLQITAPWLDGMFGLSLSGGFLQASGISNGNVSVGREWAPVELTRTRRHIPVEAGLHLLLRLGRHFRLMAEGGGGAYWVTLRSEAFSGTREISGTTYGAWGGLRLGIAAGPGVFFLAGRYAAPSPLTIDDEVIDGRMSIAEACYTFEL